MRHALASVCLTTPTPKSEPIAPAIKTKQAQRRQKVNPMANTKANPGKANPPARWGYYKRGGRFTVGASEQHGGVALSVGTFATGAKAPLFKLVAPKLVEHKVPVFGTLRTCVGMADTNAAPSPEWADVDPEILGSARFDVWTSDPDDLEQLGELLCDLGSQLIVRAKLMRRRAQQRPLN